MQWEEYFNTETQMLSFSLMLQTLSITWIKKYFYITLSTFVQISQHMWTNCYWILERFFVSIGLELMKVQGKGIVLARPFMQLESLNWLLSLWNSSAKYVGNKMLRWFQNFSVWLENASTKINWSRLSRKLCLLPRLWPRAMVCFTVETNCST